ncbi:MAG: hypothetical protein JNJ42_05465 [Burkholderiaceae bacterium]|nr:hypothetical protein [Burkholderiaceae bacterium]
MSSTHHRHDTPRAMARVIAMLLCAHERDSEAEGRMLRELDVFQRLGLTVDEFDRVVEQSRRSGLADLSLRTYPNLDDLERFDELLDAVRDPHHRIWLCRVASCVITLDGRVGTLESTLYDRMLTRWGHTRTSISRAILEDHAY